MLETLLLFNSPSISDFHGKYKKSHKYIRHRDTNFPRQTVNSAVKKLVSDGLVSLFTQKGYGNIKYLRLTPKGEELAAAYVAPLVQADIHSFSAFSPDERILLLKLMQQQLTSLKEYSEQLWN